MKYTREELTEAERQIDSTIHKLRETIRTLQAKEKPERYRSQITLAERRIKAFEIAHDLIEKEISNRGRRDMEIRYISSADDKNAISRIYEKSWKCAYRGMIPQEYLDSIPEGRWAEKVDNPEWSTMVCIENGEYIGTSSFCRSRFEQFPDSGELISIYFLPEYMGKGYGGKLLNIVMEELKKQGFSEVFLWVLEENHRARKFYEKYGFECTHDYLEDCIGGKNLREVRYVYRF